MPGHANLSEEGRESRPDPEQTETTTMGTQLSPPIPPLDGHREGARLGRLATLLAAVIAGLLAAAATAAFANPIPIPVRDGDTSHIAQVSPATVQVIIACGMAGWQVAPIAAGAARAAVPA